jgi:hypothetical protein
MIEFKIKNWQSLVDAWPQIKAAVKKALDAGKKDFVVTIQGKRRNSLTNSKIHAIIGDIRAQCVIEIGIHRLDASKELDVWKSLLVRWFDLEMTESGCQLSRPGRRIFDPFYGEWVYLRPSTTEMSQAEACKFVEWLWAFGSTRGVEWSDRAEATKSEMAGGGNGEQ